MADDESDFNEEWDEYEWERFLQQQDRNTEKYLGLLEKYIDHPDRDRIVAREMGWEITDEDSISDLAENLEDWEMWDLPESDDRVSNSPLFQQATRLNQRINRLMDRRPPLEEHPEMIRLATCAARCSAKLGAALIQDDYAELGMTIAYLKRGLKAANDGLSACEGLVERRVLTRRQLSTIRADLFAIRDTIVCLMGECRAEWRRRYGRA